MVQTFTLYFPVLGNKSLKNKLFAPMRLAVLAVLLLCTARVAQAGNLTVKVNGGTAQTGKASLLAAITASGVALGNITSLEITAGAFTADDWAYLKNQSTNLSKLTAFTITDDITSVADIPNSSDNNSYFGAALETVSIAKVKTIGSWAFNELPALTTVSMPLATTIENNAFGRCWALTDVSLPVATTFDEFAFDQCTSLVSISLPEATDIYYEAFNGCTALTTVDLPKATKIDDLVFLGCASLTSLSLPKASTIGSEAFSECKALKTVSLPSATSIYYDAFDYCISLTYLQLGATPPTVQSGEFRNIPSPRYLQLIDASGNLLTGDALTTAIAAYKAVSDGNTTDELWYGWTINGSPKTLKVKINGGSTVYEGGSLEAAIAASSIAPGSITAIEVVEGDLVASDALYMRGITTLEQLTISKSMNTLDITFEHPTLREFNASAIRVIGSDAFKACTSLTTVNLPNTLILDDAAFWRCTALTILNLPAVQIIGKSAFAGCTSLADVNFPNVTEIKSSAFNSCTAIKTVSLPKLKQVSNLAFYSCLALETLDLPLVNSIGEQAFNKCTALKTVNQPLVTQISKQAFAGCTSLADVSLPKLQSIGNEAFLNCSAFVQLQLGATPPSVGSNVFKNCHGSRFLQFIDADGNLLTGDAHTAAHDAYKAVDDGSTTDERWRGWCIATTISVRVNQDKIYTANTLQETIAASGIALNDITRIDITAGRITAIDWQFLKNQRINLNKLNTFNIQDAVTAADIPATTADEPYFGHALYSLFLKGVYNIGISAFDGCTNLAQVWLLNGLTGAGISIGDRAFANCTSLSLLILQNTPPTVTNTAFSQCPIIRYLTFVNYAGEKYNNPTTVQEIQNTYKAVADGNTADNKWHGWNITGSLTVSVNGATAKTASSLEEAIAASSTALGDITSINVTKGYFQTYDWTYLKQQRDNLTNLKEFSIDNTVDVVDNLQSTSQTLPYFGPGIEKVSIAKVKSVGSYAFEGCSSLKSVHLPNVTHIYSYAFKQCASLTYIGLPKVTTVEACAFEECEKLANISLPKLTELYGLAFYNCTSLTNIELGATPPSTKNQNDHFKNCPSPRNLRIVDDSIRLMLSMNSSTNKIAVIKVLRAIGDMGLKEAKEFADNIQAKGSMVWAIPYSTTSPDSIISAFVTAGALADRLWPEADKLSAALAAYKAHTGWNAITELWYGWTLDLPTYTLTYAAGENGTIEGETTQSIKFGHSGTAVEAKAKAGYRFVRWSDGSTTNPRTDSNVNVDISVTAEFAINSYTLTYTAGEGGSISGQVTQTVQHGGSGSEVEAVPNEGYRFVKWSDGRTTAKRTDYNVQGNINAMAEFEKTNTTGLFNSKFESLSVYPNPTTGMLWVSVPEPVEGTAANVLVYNTAGKLLQRVPARAASTGSAASRMCIDLSGYPAGVYIVRVGNAVAKVLKQ